MKFNSQICTTKIQSERLLALGLKKETADMMYSKTSYGEFIFVKDDDYLEHLDFPAWSLHRLIEMMPKKIIVNDLMVWYLSITPYYNNMVSYEHCGDMESCYLYKSAYNNVYTNIIDCIKWLIKEGHFNKEYLEE